MLITEVVKTNVCHLFDKPRFRVIGFHDQSNLLTLQVIGKKEEDIVEKWHVSTYPVKEL